MPVKVHLFNELSTARMYDRTQTDEKIKDGDVFVCNDGKTVGFLLQAWPVVLHGERGELHGMSKSGMPKLKEQYSESFKRAQALATNLVNDWQLVDE